MSWGNDLRIRREELGYTLQNAEEETKIRKLYLDALENENFSILPPKVYSIGFVKNYARFLRLDAAREVEQFKELAYLNDTYKEEVVYSDVEGKPWLPKWLNAANVFAAAAFLILAIWLGNYLVAYFTGPDIAIEPKPPVADSGEQADEAQPEVVIPGEKEPVDIIPESVNVKVIARQNCWLRVMIDGTQIFEGTLISGEEKDFNGLESVKIRAGNAGGINILFNGNDIGIFGDTGQIKEQEFTL